MGRSGKIAIGVVVALAVLLAVNALVTGAETKSAAVTEPGGRVLGLQGGALQVVDRGPRGGSPIVLIHCFTCAIDWWDRMMPRLARRHRVVAVDLLGHGGSEKPESGYSIENQADLVAEALGRLGVRGATVVGHSLGGTVSVALAERSPRLVDRIVIVDTGPDPRRWRPRPDRPPRIRPGRRGGLLAHQARLCGPSGSRGGLRPGLRRTRCFRRRRRAR